MNNEAMCPTCFVVPPTMLPDDRVALLMRISEKSLSNPRVRSIALQLRSTLSDKLGRAPTQAELAQWLADAGHLLVTYKPDPPGEEVFQSVEYTLGGAASSEVSPITGRPKGVGDCEDLAGAFVALALANGLQARVKWWSQPGAPLNHVAAEVRLNGQWTNVETTIPGAHVGETPYQALDRVGPDYRSRVFGLREAAGGVFAPAGGIESDGVSVTDLGSVDAMTEMGTVYILNMPSGGHAFIDNVEVPGDLGRLPPPGEVSPNPGAWYDGNTAGPPVYIIRMSPGFHTLTVQPQNRSTSVNIPIDMPNGATTWAPLGNRIVVDGARAPQPIVAESQVPAVASQLRIVNMPPGSRVTIDGRMTEGSWLDTSYTVWVVNSTVGPHAVQVSYPDGSVRAVQITIPPGGTSINANDMTAVPDASSDSAITPVVGAVVTTLRVMKMPHGGNVQIDGALADGRWVDPAYMQWDVPITTGEHTVRIATADGVAKSRSVNVPAEGITLEFDKMTEDTTTGAGRGRRSRTGGPTAGRTTLARTNTAIQGSSPGTDGTLTVGGVQRQDGPPVTRAPLGLVHMPPYGSVFVDGVQVQGGAWDGTNTVWQIQVAPGRRAVRVVAPGDAWTRDVTVEVPSAGTTVDVSRQTPAATATTATLGLVHMPPYGSVFVDGAPVQGGAWDATNTAWQIQVAPGRHDVRVVAPANAWTRSVTVDVPPGGASVDVGQVDTGGTDKQPAPPVADASTVELTLHADTCAAYTSITLRNAAGSVVSTTHESIVGALRPRGSDLGPQGSDLTGQCMENWRTSVAPGTYVVRAVLRNGREGTANILVPTTAHTQVVALSELAWTWAAAGRIIVHDVPQVPAPTLASSSRSERTVYSVWLTPPGGDSESAISIPPDGTDYVGFAAPGPYTLRVNESVGSTSRVYYTQSVNLRDSQTTEVYATAPHADTAPSERSGMSSVRLVGLPVNWTFAMGDAVATAMPVSDIPRSAGAVSSDPMVAAIIAANHAGLTRRAVAGQELTYGEVPVVTLPLGSGVAEITSPRGVIVHMPVTIESNAASIDVSYDVERALRYGSPLRGITGVQPTNGARVGYLSDAADVMSRQSGLRGGTKPLGEVVEFQPLSDRPDALGRVPTVIFVKNQGLQVAMVTPKEMQRVKNQIQFLRTHLLPDATYPFEIGQ